MAFLGGIVNKIGNALGLGASKGVGNGGGGQSGGTPSRAAPGGGSSGGGSKGLPGFGGGQQHGGLPGEGSNDPPGLPGGFPFPGKPSTPAPSKAPAPAPAPSKPPSTPKPSQQPQPKPQPAPTQQQPAPTQSNPPSQPKSSSPPNTNPSPSSNPQPPGGGGAGGGGNSQPASPSPSDASPDPQPSGSVPPQNIGSSPSGTGSTPIDPVASTSPQEENGPPPSTVSAGDPIGGGPQPATAVGLPTGEAGSPAPAPTGVGTSPASTPATGGSGLSPAVSATIGVVLSFVCVLLLLCIFRRWMVYRRKLRRQRVQTYAWPAALPSSRDNSTDSGWDFSSNSGVSHRSSAGFTEPPMTALPSAVLATAAANMPGNTPRAQIFDLSRLQIPPSPPHDGSAHTGSSSGRLAPAQSLDIEAEADSSYRTGTPTPVQAAFQSAWSAFPNQPQPMTLHRHHGASVTSFASSSSESSLGIVINHVEFPHPPAPSYHPFTAARPLTVETRSVDVPSPMSSPLFRMDDPFAHPMDAMSTSGHGHDAQSIVSGHAH